MSLNEDAILSQICYKIDYFMDDTSTPDVVDPREMLFRITSDAMQKVTLRIWLEGCDENCISDIAGKTFSLTVKFDSIDVPVDENGNVIE